MAVSLCALLCSRFTLSLHISEDSEQKGLRLNVWIGNRIKAYTPVWYDYSKSDGLTREG